MHLESSLSVEKAGLTLTREIPLVCTVLALHNIQLMQG